MRIIISIKAEAVQVKRYSSREIIKLIEKDGWYEIRCVGDHHQFIHPTKKGKVTVVHPVKDLTLDLISSILTQAGLK